MILTKLLYRKEPVMTYVQWESEFQKCIGSLPQKEKDEIIGYYREIYADKREAGLTDEEIIKNFGEPMLAAAKILMENNADEKDSQEAAADEPPVKEKKAEASAKPKAPAPRSNGKVTVAAVVGWFFLIILFIIPLAAVLFSAFAAVAAIMVAGFAIAVSGVVLTVASPFAFFLGYTGLGVLATLGAALTLVGVGIILFEIFYVITKYFAFACIKLVRYFLKRRKQK